MNIVWDSSTINTAQEKIRQVLSRAFVINVKASGEACPDCSLDPVTNTSTDPFCVTCGGFYWINNTEAVTLSGHVRWRGQDQPNLYAGGTVPDGDCQVTITYTDQAVTYINKSIDFVVDDRVLSLKNFQLKGQPTPNRIKIVLVEELND